MGAYDGDLRYFVRRVAPETPILTPRNASRWRSKAYSAVAAPAPGNSIRTRSTVVRIGTRHLRPLLRGERRQSVLRLNHGSATETDRTRSAADSLKLASAVSSSP